MVLTLRRGFTIGRKEIQNRPIMSFFAKFRFYLATGVLMRPKMKKVEYGLIGLLDMHVMQDCMRLIAGIAMPMLFGLAAWLVRGCLACPHL